MNVCDNLGPAYRQKVYRNGGNSELLKLMPVNARNILDLGCGAGDNARLLKERGHTVFGITLSESEAQIAKDHCEQTLIANVERDELPFPDHFFDAIVASHVLEHLVCPRAALIALHRYIMPGGKLLIAVPNMAFWRLRVRFILGNWRREETGAMDRTHLHFYSYDTAPDILAGTPFRLDAHQPGDLAVPMWPLRRIVPAFSHAVDNLIGRWMPNSAALQVLLVASAIETIP